MLEPKPIIVNQFMQEIDPMAPSKPAPFNRKSMRAISDFKSDIEDTFKYIEEMVRDAADKGYYALEYRPGREQEKLIGRIKVELEEEGFTVKRTTDKIVITWT